MSMAVADTLDLETYCRQTAEQARRASAALALVGGDIKNAWLRRAAELLRT
jgi:hypothetical protein